MNTTEQHINWLADETFKAIKPKLFSNFGEPTIFAPSDGRKSAWLLRSHDDVAALLCDYHFEDGLREFISEQASHYDIGVARYLASHFEDYIEDIQQEPEEWLLATHPAEYEGVIEEADAHFIEFCAYELSQCVKASNTTIFERPALKDFEGDKLGYYFTEAANPFACALLARVCDSDGRVSKEALRKSCLGWVSPALVSGKVDSVMEFLTNTDMLRDALNKLGYTPELFMEAVNAGVPIEDILA